MKLERSGPFEGRRARMLAVLALLLSGGRAHAHPLAPSLLELVEAGSGRIDVVWRTPASGPPGVDLRPRWPAGCRLDGQPRGALELGSMWTQRFRLTCAAASVVGQAVGVDGLEIAGTDALVRVELADGRHFQRVLRGAAARFVVPERERPTEVAWSYLGLGAGHIATGIDHLLFVLGLLLLTRGGRALVWTVTAFTLGHSVTLSLAALGFVAFPSGPIELAIAASIFVLAVELARDGSTSPGRLRRWPWLMSFAFGLLHGLGFAGALAEVGLPQRDIPLALLSFNVGIEVGQLAFVLLVLALARGGARIAHRTPRGAEWIPRLEWVPVYGIGIAAAYWCVERAADVLG